MYLSNNFLAVVFKKQEISQQVVTRMQYLASEFSEIFRGDTRGPSQREGATPSPAGGGNPLPHQTPWKRPGAVRKRFGVGTQTLVPLNFSAVVAPLQVHRNPSHAGNASARGGPKQFKGTTYKRMRPNERISQISARYSYYDRKKIEPYCSGLLKVIMVYCTVIKSET